MNSLCMDRFPFTRLFCRAGLPLAIVVNGQLLAGIFSWHGGVVLLTFLRLFTAEHQYRRDALYRRGMFEGESGEDEGRIDHADSRSWVRSGSRAERAETACR